MYRGLLARGINHPKPTIARELATPCPKFTTTPKTTSGERSIDAPVVATLRTWRQKQAEDRLAWGAVYEDVDGLVFTWENGRPLLPDYVTKQIGKEQTGLGMPRLTLHELRHSHATILLRAGVPVHTSCPNGLGHIDPSVTLNVYADVIPDDDTSAVHVLFKAVWGA